MSEATIDDFPKKDLSFTEKGGVQDNESPDYEKIDAEDASRYVNAVVPLSDDPSMTSLTFRAALLGLVFGLLNSFVTAFFSFRTVPISIPGGFTILFSYPIGVFLSKVIPSGIFNPGPFSIKEHIIVYIISSAAGGQPYGIDNVVGQYYFLEDGGATFWPSLAFIIVTQFIGYGLSGLTRRFLVRPPAMFWPGNLPYIALFQTIHETEEDRLKTKEVGVLSRWSMFSLVFAFIFIWEWFPQYFATILQSIALLCLFSNSNAATWLGAAYSGEGYGVLSINFDWAVLSSYALLYSPFYVTLVNVSGYIFFYWIVGPLIEISNPFGAPFMPSPSGHMFRDNTTFQGINTNKLYTNDGQIISAKSLLTPEFKLNQSKYDLESPIYLSNAFALLYFSSFFIIAAALTHVGLWYGKDIWKQTKEAMRQVRQDEGDVHAELMKAYPDVPDWIYLIFTAVMLVAAIFVFQFTSFKLEWWATLFAFGLGLIYIIPIGIIQALTGQQVGLNVITEFLIGLMLPGHFVDVITFKSFGYNIMIQALALTSDLKLGHYMHINPIHMVIAQLFGTMIGSVVVTNTAFYVMDNLRDLLENNADWAIVNYGTFVNAGAIWGAIGPARFFGPQSPYWGLLFGFPIGFVAPLLPWLANKVYPSKYWHYVNFAVFAQLGNPAQNNSWFLIGLLVSFIFQYYIFNYHYAWYSKYNFVIATALDTGTNIAVLCISFLLIGHIEPSDSVLSPKSSYDYYCFLPETSE